MELPSRARKLLLVAGAGCTMLGGLVLWKDTVAGKKIEQIKSEKEIKVRYGTGTVPTYTGPTHACTASYLSTVLLVTVVDPEPDTVGSEIMCRIRNYSFRIRQDPTFK